MKLPNGYGSIHKLSGNRRKPWRVRKTDGWEIVDGKIKQKFINVGCYETRPEALAALAEFNKDPYDLGLSTITIAEVYERWSERKFEEISDSNAKGYEAAFKLMGNLQRMRFVDLKIDHIQNVIDESGKNTPTLRKFKILMKAMFEYAVIHGIIPKERNIVEYLDISKAGNPNALNREPFSKNEIGKLWEVVDANEYIPVVLILIYSGLRIDELLDLKKSEVNLTERYFDIVKSKTDSGVRLVPISQKILPFVEYWMQKNDCEYLISTPDAEQMIYRNYYDTYWKPLMLQLNMGKYVTKEGKKKPVYEGHRPHDTRHTCVSLMTSAKVDERFIQKIVGHKGQNVTRAVYTHLEIQELINEIDKI